METIRIIALVLSITAFCVAVTGLILTLTRMKRLYRENENLMENLKHSDERYKNLQKISDERASRYTELVQYEETNPDAWSVHELKKSIREKFIKMITEDIESYIDWEWTTHGYISGSTHLRGKINIKRKG